jgi:predicted ATPase
VTRTEADWLAIYGRHLDNVRAALDWAFSTDGDPEIGVAITVGVVPLWFRLSIMTECHERVEKAMQKWEASADSPRTKMQLSAALATSLTIRKASFLRSKPPG